MEDPFLRGTLWSGEFLDRLRKPVRYYELDKRPGNSAEIIPKLSRIIRDSGAEIRTHAQPGLLSTVCWLPVYIRV